MKNYNFISFLIMIVIIPLPFSYANDLYIDIKVKNTGEIDIAGKVSGQSASSKGAMLFLIPLPFNLRPNTVLEAAQDVKLAVASSGNGYTILSLIAESTGNPVSFGIKNGITFSETSEGKAKLEMFPNFRYMTNTEKNLMSQSIATTNIGITIQLPKQYNSTEVGFRPLTVKTTDNQAFIFSQISVPDISGDEYWLVFPNPATDDLKWAQIVISFLFGLFTIAFHVPALKKGNLTWQLFVLFLSSIILGVSIYFTYSLAKKLDFGIFIAASIPHVTFGLLATLWLFLTKRYRVVISGTVYKNHVPVQYATVILEKKKGTGFVETKSVRELSENGRFSFSTLLLKAKTATYRIKARMIGAQDAMTDEFNLSRSETKEETIELIPIPQPRP
jgi:hypothetical protein